MPLQQSEGFRQLAPRGRHWQRPLTQVIVPQHSLEARHAAPEGVQHCTAPVVAMVRHSSEPQHCSEDVQVVSP